jgi:hypothetical protein
VARSPGFDKTAYKQRNAVLHRLFAAASGRLTAWPEGSASAPRHFFSGGNCLAAAEAVGVNECGVDIGGLSRDNLRDEFSDAGRMLERVTAVTTADDESEVPVGTADDELAVGAVGDHAGGDVNGARVEPWS